ncbi:MAG: helix-turn-helix domain-containing protein [Candidatus Nanohaloarchaea archaeon]|nr:helix-turn-helix domain-containing protein [Candidatus Nanohaloarchaea archaeon]
MLPGLATKIEELRKKRRQRGMTQTELAERAGVSQSFIAKMEAGKASPGYEKLRRVEETLSEDHQPIETFTEPAVTVEAGTPAREAIAAVVDAGYAIVVEEGRQVGSLEPVSLLPHTTGSFDGTTAEGIMSEPFPTLPPHADEDDVRSLLSVSPVIAVVSGDEVVGAVTRRSVLRERVEDI